MNGLSTLISSFINRLLSIFSPGSKESAWDSYRRSRLADQPVSSEEESVLRARQ
jgi:hypothetical protein